MKGGWQVKIGFVLDESFDGTDGIQQYMLTLGGWLSRRGHVVHYLVGQTSRTDVDSIWSLSRNVKVQFNGNRLSVPLPTNQKKLRSVMEDLQLDVLHVQAPYSPFLSGRLIHFASAKVAVVGTFHIMPFGRLARMGSNVLGKINSSTAKRFDAMMAVSAPAQEFAGKHFGFQSVVVPNPFLWHVFSKAGSSISPRHKKLRIVFLGRLVTRKGPKLLLTAVDELVNTRSFGRPLEVIIAGRGPQLAEMKKYASEHNLEKIVSFPGYVAEEDKAVFLASADLLVFPSPSGESFGISLIEAMAAGRGVVLAGDNPGYASVIADKRQLVQVLDRAAFARSLEFWLENRQESAELVRLQKKHARSFDIELIGPKIEQIYKDALQKRKGS